MGASGENKNGNGLSSVYIVSISVAIAAFIAIAVLLGTIWNVSEEASDLSLRSTKNGRSPRGRSAPSPPNIFEVGDNSSGASTEEPQESGKKTKTPSFHPVATSEPESKDQTAAASPTVSLPSSGSLAKNSFADVVQAVIVISSSSSGRSEARGSRVEDDLAQIFCKDDNIFTKRLPRVENRNDMSPRDLSHLLAVSECLRSNKNTMILEDDFRFAVGRDDMMRRFQRIEREGMKWHVIVLGDCRDIDGPEKSESKDWSVVRVKDYHSLSGYVVHRGYAHTIFSAWLESTNSKGRYDTMAALQKESSWIGFSEPFGRRHFRSGTPDFGPEERELEGDASESWCPSGDTFEFPEEPDR